MEKSKRRYTRHGAWARHPKLCKVWHTMVARCENPRHPKYRIYGARGITVCEEWHDPNRFIDWALANGYREGLQIDRMDNLQGYSPDNCRWTTAKENARNTRRNVYLTIGGARLTVAGWAEAKGINPKTVYGWTYKYGVDEAARRVARF